MFKEGLDGKYYGDLASAWTHSDDGLTWTFTLKVGIVWHTGGPLAAEDLAWSINEIRTDPALAAVAAGHEAACLLVA